MTDVDIRDAIGGELVAGCSLLAASLGFPPRDALPPWLVQTTASSGGIALGAFDEATLIGFSVAIPAEPDAVFSCGLAVEPAYRGRGIGKRLKLAQRERALAASRSVIRWTADPLSAAALRLYLSGLGARLVAYEPDLYADVRPSSIPHDDVTIEWRLRDPPRGTGGPAASVEVPLDRRQLAAGDLGDWRMRVRQEMSRALERGHVGSGVELDAASGRAWVLFSEAAA